MTMRTILRPVRGNAFEIAFTAATGGVKNATPFLNSAIGIEVTHVCYIKFGKSDVTVSASDYDIRLTPNKTYEFDTGGATHIAILKASSDNGTAYINEYTRTTIA